MSHFEGKSIPEHLKLARLKGMDASKEIHGVEPAGAFFSFLDSSRETILILAFILTLIPSLSPFFLLPLAIALALWKGCRSAFLGFSRLKRIESVIQQEREEIRVNRREEKEELKAIYAAKGFTSPLLEKVVDVLSSDDNKMLAVMLEEELGLHFESQDHPLYQGIMAFSGSILSSFCGFIGFFFFAFPGMCLTVGAIVVATTLLANKKEKNPFLPSTIWALASAALSISSLYFFKQIVEKMFSL